MLSKPLTLDKACHLATPTFKQQKNRLHLFSGSYCQILCLLFFFSIYHIVFFFFLLLYLFLAALGLHCCAQAFSSCGERGLLFVAVHTFLIAVASLVAEHRL